MEDLLFLWEKGRRKKDKEELITHFFINCTSKRQGELMTRMEEMSASGIGLKTELYYHGICEEEDLSNLETIFRNAAKILNFHYARSINFQCKETESAILDLPTAAYVSPQMLKDESNFLISNVITLVLSKEVRKKHWTENAKWHLTVTAVGLVVTTVTNSPILSHKQILLHVNPFHHLEINRRKMWGQCVSLPASSCVVQFV